MARTKRLTLQHFGNVILDPRFGWGRPVVATNKVPPNAILGLWRAGEHLSAIAEEFAMAPTDRAAHPSLGPGPRHRRLSSSSIGRGSTFTQGLRDLGWLVTSITDVFTNDAQEVSDTDWMRYGCDAGWAALTKDVKIRRSPHYDAATRPIFALSDGNLPLRENVRRFEAWRDKIWTVATGDAGREFWVCSSRHLERNACQQRQIVDLVLIWTSHLPQLTLIGDQMVKVLVGGGKGKIPIGPVYFTRDYVRPGWLRDKKYPQGGRGVVLREHTFFGKVTHVDLRLADGEFLLEVPIDYIRTLD